MTISHSAFGANPSISVGELLNGQRPRRRSRGVYITFEREGRAAGALVKRLERLAAGPAPALFSRSEIRWAQREIRARMEKAVRYSRAHKVLDSARCGIEQALRLQPPEWSRGGRVGLRPNDLVARSILDAFRLIGVRSAGMARLEELAAQPRQPGA